VASSTKKTPNDKVDIKIIEMHEAIPSRSFSSGECGNPMYRDGIVLNSFPVSDWFNRL
jgi:hypothetical protein